MSTRVLIEAQALVRGDFLREHVRQDRGNETFLALLKQPSTAWNHSAPVRLMEDIYVEFFRLGKVSVRLRWHNRRNIARTRKNSLY
jgi:hypothetical protein